MRITFRHGTTIAVFLIVAAYVIIYYTHIQNRRQDQGNSINTHIVGAIRSQFDLIRIGDSEESALTRLHLPPGYYTSIPNAYYACSSVNDSYPLAWITDDGAYVIWIGLDHQVTCTMKVTMLRNKQPD